MAQQPQGGGGVQPPDGGDEGGQAPERGDANGEERDRARRHLTAMLVRALVHIARGALENKDAKPLGRGCRWAAAGFLKVPALPAGLGEEDFIKQSLKWATQRSVQDRYRGLVRAAFKVPPQVSRFETSQRATSLIAWGHMSLMTPAQIEDELSQVPADQQAAAEVAEDPDSQPAAAAGAGAAAAAAAPAAPVFPRPLLYLPPDWEYAHGEEVE
eukprot:TRINITY_DN8268_c1_g1_i2.p2 TRINITY_DN8268_c1_g1~~TRINITY_DN8268_c1_g1_i2.p2  ORF type:complete len:214 (+),score=49.02 TRINITY_DN8268_c1_g1_i2:119-760(+)